MPCFRNISGYTPDGWHLRITAFIKFNVGHRISRMRNKMRRFTVIKYVIAAKALPSQVIFISMLVCTRYHLHLFQCAVPYRSKDMPIINYSHCILKTYFPSTYSLFI